MSLFAVRILPFIFLVGANLFGEMEQRPNPREHWPRREQQTAKIKSEHFDLLIVGGGATGAGVALDAVTRGLKVALVERDDFSSGTSSRSTKLVHGGVRYLEQAFKRFDTAQYHLVKEALHERATMLENAPHLARPIRLLTPLYRWWEIPYYWFGLKLYDWLSGGRSLGSSHYIGAERTLQRFPALNDKGLKGSVVYYDGQFDDSRYNLSLLLTAASHGAAVANYVETVSLNKKEGNLIGATLRDSLTGETWNASASVIINATGPYADALRQLDDPEVPAIIAPSSGTHLVFDQQLAPQSTGLLIPKTEDGRVLFLLPWEGGTLVGTTDESAALQRDPKPTEEEIDYLLHHLQTLVTTPLTRESIRSSWTGLRPLVKDPRVKNTAKLVRDHYLEVSGSGLVTISGGKWTTYRKMAQDTVDRAIAVGNLQTARPCQTETCLLVGSSGYHHTDWQHLVEVEHLDEDIARHLNASYGNRAVEIAALARQGYGDRLAKGYPYIEAEVVYAVDNEYARTPTDVLQRRTRLFFLDQNAAIAALPRVTQLMAQRLAWTDAKSNIQKEQALTALASPISTR